MNSARACCRGGEYDSGSGFQKVGAMMLSYSEDIESNLVGELDLLDQVIQTLRWTQRFASVGVRRREAIDADLHPSRFPPPDSRFLPPLPSDREILTRPCRKTRRLPAGEFVCKRNLLVGIRT